MEFLARIRTAALWTSSLLPVLAGCSSGDLSSIATSVALTQREANLTRTNLSGTWKGEISTPDGVGSQPFFLVFVQGTGFSLDGSLLVGEDIRLGGVVKRDTFALANGVFINNEIRFNLAEKGTGTLILTGGIPVLFTGLLSENTYMSGELKASTRLIGLWEASLAGQTP